MTKGYIACVEI